MSNIINSPTKIHELVNQQIVVGDRTYNFNDYIENEIISEFPKYSQRIRNGVFEGSKIIDEFLAQLTNEFNELDRNYQNIGEEKKQELTNIIMKGKEELQKLKSSKLATENEPGLITENRVREIAPVPPKATEDVYGTVTLGQIKELIPKVEGLEISRYINLLSRNTYKEVDYFLSLKEKHNLKANNLNELDEGDLIKLLNSVYRVLLFRHTTFLNAVFENENATRILFESENATRILFENENATRILFENENATRILFENENATRILFENENATRILFESEQAITKIFKDENIVEFIAKNKFPTVKTNITKNPKIIELISENDNILDIFYKYKTRKISGRGRESSGVLLILNGSANSMSSNGYGAYKYIDSDTIESSIDLDDKYSFIKKARKLVQWVRTDTESEDFVEFYEF